MNRYRIILSTGVAALAASALVVGAQSGTREATTIKTTLFFTGATNIDADRSGGPSVGDLVIAPGFYVNESGKRSGSVHASCLQVNAAGTAYNCTDYSHFAGGDIITGDRFSPTEKMIHQAVLGGTGVYAGMRGASDGPWLAKDFSKARLTFRLTG